jgi:hypothetical protein
VDPTLIQEAPFLFVYQPALLMNGSWGEIVVAFGSALIGITALSAAVAGHMFGPPVVAPAPVPHHGVAGRHQSARGGVPGHERGVAGLHGVGRSTATPGADSGRQRGHADRRDGTGAARVRPRLAWVLSRLLGAG